MISSFILFACLFAFGFYHDKKIKEQEERHQWIVDCRYYLRMLVNDYERECRKAFHDALPIFDSSKYKKTIRSLREEHRRGLCEKIAEVSRNAVKLEHIPSFLLEEHEKNLEYIEDIYWDVATALYYRK